MGLVKFSQKKTIMAQPLEDGIKDAERYSILKKRDTILSKVSDFISKHLDPSKDTYQKDLSIDGVLLELQPTIRHIIGHFLYQVKMILSCI